MSTNNGSQIVKQVARLDSVQTCLILFVHSVKHQPKHHPKQCLIVFGRQPFPVRTGLQSLENAVMIVPGDILAWRNSSFKDPRLLLELLLFKTSQGNVLTELTLHSNVQNLYMWRQITKESLSFEWFSVWNGNLVALAIHPEDEVTMNRDSKPRQTQLLSRQKNR